MTADKSPLKVMVIGFSAGGVTGAGSGGATGAAGAGVVSGAAGAAVEAEAALLAGCLACSAAKLALATGREIKKATKTLRINLLADIDS